MTSMPVLIRPTNNFLGQVMGSPSEGKYNTVIVNNTTSGEVTFQRCLNSWITCFHLKIETSHKHSPLVPNRAYMERSVAQLNKCWLRHVMAQLNKLNIPYQTSEKRTGQPGQIVYVYLPLVSQMTLWPLEVGLYVNP